MLHEPSVVYKYFDLIDGFIRIRVLPEDQPLPVPRGRNQTPPDRREYRRLVVHNCVLELEDFVLPKVRQIYPEDAAAAEDLLYQICVDVNPRLEIHTVALPAGAGEAEAEEVLDPDFRERARNLEECLRKEIVGQEEALLAVTRAVRKASCGLNDPSRPLGSFLLVGRTGTGKTELAKAVARNLFGPDGLVRIDCSEYALPHETAKLIGAPPGYVGHNEGGTLTEALLRNPSAVILFDEVEKAHEKLHNMLLQILDEGRLTDSKGRTVLFRSSVVLLTSNVGTSDYREADNRIGFGREEGLPSAEYERLTRTALGRSFKPELLNRLDATLIFRPLDRQDCTRIAVMQLERLAQRMQRAGIRMRWTPGLGAMMADKGTSEEYGAREIRRTVDREVEEPLSTQILEGELGPGDEVTVGCRNRKTTFQRKALPRRRRAG